MDYPYALNVSKAAYKAANKTTALLELDDWSKALEVGLKLVLKHAEAHARGKTEMVCCTPELADLIKNNPEFFSALTEPGVIEWLMPLVKPTYPKTQ